MRMTNGLQNACMAALVAISSSTLPAAAQPIDAMLNECSSVGQTYFRDFTARTRMKYNGQRVDGTHALNGRILLETRFEDFACSYDRRGRRMVEFFAEGRVQNAYLPGGDSGGTDIAQVTGVASNDVLNVHSGPGTNYRIVGALSNGTSVRNLGCQGQSHSHWCQIEMMTDMRERGWVSARYLTTAPSGQRPRPPVSDPGDTNSERLRFSPGTTGTEITRSLAPGSSTRFVLGARNRQNLYVRVAPRRGQLDYQIFNPDRSFLLNQIGAEQEYRGQLWQSGDHVIEVINRRNVPVTYNLIVSVK